MPSRVAAAQIAHETNVFSSVRTDFAAFSASGIHLGPEILSNAVRTNTEFGGFITGAEAQGFALVPILAVWATPSGMVTKEAIDRLRAAAPDIADPDAEPIAAQVADPEERAAGP